MFCFVILVAMNIEKKDSVHLDAPLRLAHLPVVAFVIRKMGIASSIDKAIPPHHQNVVTHGQCVELLLICVFAGFHGLWRLREHLASYDMPLIMDDPDFSLEPFHDDRLGRALDALHKHGLDYLMSDVAMKTIEAFSLDIEYQSFDTTSLSFYGDNYSEEDGDSDSDNSPPVVTHGYAKNKRFDLKQIMYGSLVTHDGGVPLFGKAMNGNQSDEESSALFMGHIRKLVKDPSEIAFVADSKGWCPRVLEQSNELGIRVLSRLSRNTSLSKKLLENPPAITDTVFTDDKEEDYRTIAGSDEEFSYTIKNDDESTTKRTIPVRTIVCFSSKLYRQKEHSFNKKQKKETKEVEKYIKRQNKQLYACETDATAALKQSVKNFKSKTLTISGEVISFEETIKRTEKGRPKKDSEASKTQTKYKIELTAENITTEQKEKKLKDSATFILIRTKKKGWDITDTEMSSRYLEQWRCEHGFSWLKSTAAINPMYLETPKRINSLCYIYTLALMIQTLTQRTVRKYLTKHSKGLPYHRNKPSSKITTRFYYDLFTKITSQQITINNETTTIIHGYNDTIKLAIQSIGATMSLYHQSNTS